MTAAFAFVHQSIMEWLVADAAARLCETRAADAQILPPGGCPALMVDFFADLAGHRRGPELGRRGAG